MSRIVFRVDASSRIGTGHTVRCLTLADVLRELGAECIFIHRLHPGHMGDAIRSRGYVVYELPAPESVPDSAADADYAAWLGVSTEQDARETLEALGNESADWLIVDHYSLDAGWESRLRPHVGRIAVIDDLANRVHDCDLLLDQNHVPEPEQRYSALVPEHATRLCGPRYALLRREYARVRHFVGPRRGPLSRVLVFYGGADVNNETARALRVLSRPEFAHLAVDVVIGVNNVHRKTLMELADKRPGTTCHGPREHLVDLTIEADLAVGAGGTTTWERCALGLPGIVTAVAENQRIFNEALAADGVIRYLGHASQLSDERLAAALQAFIDNPSTLTDLATRSWRVTDGLGVLRAAEMLCPSDREALSLRGVQPEDKVFSLKWANERDVCRLLMVTPPGLPVGEVRVAAQGDDAVLDYHIDTDFEDRGWSSRLLELAADAWHIKNPGTLLYRPIRSDPVLSQARFLRAGFADAAELKQSEVLSLTILSDSGSWINAWIPALLAGWLRDGHRVRWIHDPSELVEGDICFLLSCGQRVTSQQLTRHRNNMVVHESDLPKGRGWSPLTWLILEGADRIPVTLLEAVDELDAGDIYLQQWMELNGYELINELREQQARLTMSLCREFVNRYPAILNDARPQQGEPTWYPRRTPQDSELDPERNMLEQFNLLRIVDNQRYPAFFRIGKQRYRLFVEREEDE